jgi:hypothetical protein
MAATSTITEKPKFILIEKVKPFLVPYYITLAAVLGAATVGFIVLIAVIVLVATNFNLLGAIE